MTKNKLNLPKSESFDNKFKRTSSSVQSKYEEEAKKKLKKRPELIKNPPKPPSTARQNPTSSSSIRKSHDIKGWMASAKRPHISDLISDEENGPPHPVSSPKVTTPTGNSRSSNTGITQPTYSNRFLLTMPSVNRQFVPYVEIPGPVRDYKAVSLEPSHFSVKVWGIPKSEL